MNFLFTVLGSLWFSIDIGHDCQHFWTMPYIYIYIFWKKIIKTTVTLLGVKTSIEISLGFSKGPIPIYTILDVRRDPLLLVLRHPWCKASWGVFLKVCDRVIFKCLKSVYVGM